MGFCARLAGRCPTQAAVMLLGFCSGLDELCWAFGCYLLLFYLYSAAVPGLDVKTSSPAQSPTVSSHCFDTMKILALLLLLFFASPSAGQDTTAFKLTFTTYNHAERIFNGTTTYILTPSWLKVAKTYYGDTNSKTVYSKSLSKKQKVASSISNIRLDSLKEFYFNYCVMATSGNEYFLDYLNNSTNKRIRLHHYYLKELDDIIQIINSNLPKKYRIRYLTRNTKQDCNL